MAASPLADTATPLTLPVNCTGTFSHIVPLECKTSTFPTAYTSVLLDPATGLAWAPVGGQILFIETSGMKGKGGLMLTGKLGEVMKESATAALTYIKSHASELGIDEEVFAATDLHVHVPEGAIPKDGPSAGVAMVSSLASMLLGRPVRRDVAMTGEITLRGDVLPVGGIGEKVLAALRAGIRELVLPPLNEKDVLEIPEDIRAGVVFHYPHTIREALAIVMDTSGDKR